MPGSRRRKPLRSISILACLILLMGWAAGKSAAEEVRRSMPHLRPLLMGDAQVAVADEAAVLLYNPAGVAGTGASSFEVFVPQITFNDPVKLALVDQEKFQQELDKLSDDIDNERYDQLLSKEFFTDIQLRIPTIVLPSPGIAVYFGVEALANLEVLENPVVPLIHVEFFADAVVGLSKFGKVTENFWLGGTAKVINRRGVDRVYTAGDFSATADSSGSLEDRKEFQDLSDGVSFTRLGLDVGSVWWLPFAREWHPRVGFSAINIGGADEDGLTGMEFGPRQNEFEPPQAGELPQLNTLGFAVSPDWKGIRFTIALDIVDVTRTVFPENDYNRRLRLGTEIGLFPHEDGASRFALLAGWNQGHTSFGALGRIWIFEVGFGIYTVELGADSGDNPDRRTVFDLGFRF